MRLLIAHDSEFFASALADRLRGAFEVRCCTDGEDALDILEEFCPDALVINTNLPRRDGICVLEMSTHQPEIILFTTCYHDPALVARCTQMGGYDLLVMPSVSATAGKLLDAVEGLPSLLQGITVEQILIELGMPPVSEAFSLICQASALLAGDLGQSLSRDIYPRLKGDPRTAEKNIRTAIHRIWRTGNRRAWKKYFPGTSECPGNKTFLLLALQADRNRRAQKHGVLRNGTVHG